MKLYIAEKPSLGRAIAGALPRPIKQHSGYLQAANGDCVSWCFGHLLEQASPEQYDSQYKKWQLDDLPIIPEHWKLNAKPQHQKQIHLLKKLCQQADQIIHAGDPDREGQLLVDQLIHYCRLPEKKYRSVQRLLISDLNITAVKHALQNLKPNSEFKTLSTCALARSRADWLIGINLSRAYTLQGQQNRGQTVLSVGRVQTPLLGIIVKRQQQIEQFVSQTYYDVHAIINIERQSITAKWQPSDACERYSDQSGRIISKQLAEHVGKKIKGQIAFLQSIDKKNQRLSSPLPYNLSSLQIDAATIYKLNAKKVLDVCQSLYEKHKLITYPRSDNRYLPDDHFKQAKSIINIVRTNLSQAKSSSAIFDRQKLNQCNFSLKHKAWNDNRVEAHHAIIPTQANIKVHQLSGDELKIYQLICRQYAALFFDQYVSEQQTLHFVINGGTFIFQQQKVIDFGWKQLWPQKNVQYIDFAFQENQQFDCTNSQIIEKQTQPPAFFTDATLIKAMTGIARYVQAPDIKATLKEHDGIGTEATRAGIIELLFKRHYVKKEGHNIHATELGMKLIENLPASLTEPDLTAIWEQTLSKIQSNQSSYTAFMSECNQLIHDCIKDSKQPLKQPYPSLPAIKPYKSQRKRKIKKKSTSKQQA